MTWNAEQERKVLASLAIIADKAGYGDGNIVPDMEEGPLESDVDFVTDTIIGDHLSRTRADAKAKADAETAKNDTAGQDAAKAQQAQIDAAVAAALQAHGVGSQTPPNTPAPPSVQPIPFEAIRQPSSGAVVNPSPVQDSPATGTDRGNIPF